MEFTACQLVGCGNNNGIADSRHHGNDSDIQAIAIADTAEDGMFNTVRPVNCKPRLLYLILNSNDLGFCRFGFTNNDHEFSPNPAEKCWLKCKRPTGIIGGPLFFKYCR